MIFINLLDRAKAAINIFKNKDPTDFYNTGRGSYSQIPTNIYRNLSGYSNEESIITSIYDRIATDVANLKFKHVNTDENGYYVSTRNSKINERLTLSPNIDQTPIDFFKELVTTIFKTGAAAIVATDWTPVTAGENLYTNILEMRVGVITEWYPRHVKIDLYNEETGLHEEILMSKADVAIVQNPFYKVMNRPNATVKRLTNKLATLDIIDDRNAAGKLDIIIKLPFLGKHPNKEDQARKRRLEIEEQLRQSNYGISYIDGVESITQLNRPAESNVMLEVESLTKQLFTELGMSPTIFDGTASAEEKMQYYDITVGPIADNIVYAMNRTYLTKTALAQKQAIAHFRNPFNLVPVEKLADTADKLLRNEIMTSNEFRGLLGLPQKAQKSANELHNPNMGMNKQIPNQNDSNVNEGGNI